MLTATLLEPLYAPTWPETPHRQATVVCEGPSAYNASPDKLHAACLDGPIIAVNRAIAFSDVLPVDVWATSDDPRLLWDWAQPHLHDAAKLWTIEDRCHIWEALTGSLERLYAWHPSSMTDEGLKDSNGLYPLVPTLFPVLAWLLHVGVRDVRLLGVDMVGTGTPFLDDWKEASDEAYAMRWAVEREFLAHSTRFYRAKGARITRWVP